MPPAATTCWPEAGTRDGVHPGRILQDDRHLDVALIHVGDIETRLFAGWDMRDDPPRSWMWGQAEVRAGALREATAASVQAISARLAREAAVPAGG